MHKKQSEISEQNQRMEAELTKRDTMVAAQSEAIMALQEQLGRMQERIREVVHNEVRVELNPQHTCKAGYRSAIGTSNLQLGSPLLWNKLKDQGTSRGAWTLSSMCK